MDRSESRTERIPVELPNGATIQVEVETRGREDVGLDTHSFQELSNILEGLVEALAVPLQKAKPQKASVKFGLEMAVESGSLTAAIVKGAGKANLEITLEWNQKP